MDMTEGKEFYQRLIPIAKGKELPNRADPLEWITYDVFASMRGCDETLTKDVLDMLILCITSQVDEERLNCTSLGALLKQRVKEGGAAYVGNPWKGFVEGPLAKYSQFCRSYGSIWYGFTSFARRIAIRRRHRDKFRRAGHHRQ